jgi:hypothetical protein
VKVWTRLAAVCLTAALGSAPCLAAAPAAATAHTVRRTVLALYDGARSASARDTPVHTLAEMPLNYLGLVVRYHDIRQGLPSIDTLDDVRGVVTWFVSEGMPNPRGYLRWIEDLARAGKPLVVMGFLGAIKDEHDEPVPLDAINRALGYLGWRYDGGWHTTTAGAAYEIADHRLIGFERTLPRLVLPYATVRASAADARSVLRVAMPNRPAAGSDLVIISPRGAFVAPGYAYFADRSGDREFRQWYLNPFEFFRQAFATDDLPKADTATLSGRRIYYSHVDGDGWRNLTQIEPYRTRYTIAARVVLDEIIRKFPDLPVSVGAVIGDLDPQWAGTPDSLDTAKALYRLPHVEAAIHTYSHPLDWRAYAPPENASVQIAPTGEVTEDVAGPDVLEAGSTSEPRTYTTRPFSLTLEIDEAAAFLNRLLPLGKRVALLQWSGNTRPFPQAIRHAQQSGLANINGGDTRFDREFPSVAWVSPLGTRPGGALQVYASNSNENTYTDLWRGRFFGFSFLSRTVRNTGAPRRLKPFNVYYHMYSGERLSSLNAVLANLMYARSLPLAPIDASRFGRIVEGFYSVTLTAQDRRAWLVGNRGALQTIRFDAASLDGVDFARSRGVIGQRHELGSLFVALDEAHTAPLIALKPVAASESEPREPVPYLVESRWRVRDVRRVNGGVTFVTEGYGPGEAVWSWPHGGSTVVRWRTASGQTGESRVEIDGAGLLVLRLPQATGEQVDVEIAGGRDTSGPR